MKRGDWIFRGAFTVVVFTVLFIPGVAEYIEGSVLGWLVRLAT